MNDKAVMVVLIYMLFSFAFGMLLGKIIQVGRKREDDQW
jgi:hypothetical protein